MATRGRPDGHSLKVRVKTAKRRKSSSTRWLQRQLNDPYVAEAQQKGYRSRAAFKILQIDDKFHFFHPGARVVDLGAAPGGWTQIAVEKINAMGRDKDKQGLLVAVDIQEVDALAGAVILHGDAETDEMLAQIKDELGGPADIVLSDMAPSTSGHPPTDHLRIIGLCESALDIARELLAPGGVFVAKVFQGGAQGELLLAMKGLFKSVKHFKPPASRKESAETYVIATGFRGDGDEARKD